MPTQTMATGESEGVEGVVVDGEAMVEGGLRMRDAMGGGGGLVRKRKARQRGLILLPCLCLDSRNERRGLWK